MVVGVENLFQHLTELRMTLIGLRNPLPPAAFELFNRLLDDTKRSRDAGSLIREIRDRRPKFSRTELILKTARLPAGLRPDIT